MKNVLIGKGVAALVAAPVLGGMEQLAIRLLRPRSDATHRGRRGKGRVHKLVHILEVPRLRVGAPKARVWYSKGITDSGRRSA